MVTPNERQVYVEAKLSDPEGRALWQSLHRNVRDQGLLAPAFAETLLRLGTLLVLLAATLWLSWFAGSWLGHAVAGALLALLLAQFAFVGHNAGHGSIARTPAANRAFGHIAMTFVAGLAFDEWIARHRAHHQFCQDESRDPDLAVTVVASLTEEATRRKGALGRFMTRHQATHIWLLTLLFGHSQRHLSQAAVLGDLGRHRLDAVMLLLHVALWFGIPCVLLQVSFSTALLAYVIPVTLLGPYFAAIFWVNHVGMPLVRQVETFSFFEHQVVTSRTIINPPALDWLFGGLNFQIEHHLFPQVASHRLSAVQAIVRAHFARQGVAYHGVSWRDAARSVATHLRHVARAA